MDISEPKTTLEKLLGKKRAIEDRLRMPSLPVDERQRALKRLRETERAIELAPKPIKNGLLKVDAF